MKHYETIYIANPNLGDEEYGDILTKFRDSIEKLKGIIIKTEEWGKQKLAYELRKFDSGFYVLTEYCGDPGMTGELERNLKLDERILKYQTVKLADTADPEVLIQQEKENREKSRIRAAEASEEEMHEESLEEGPPEDAEIEEDEYEDEGPVDAAEDLVDAGEVQNEGRKETSGEETAIQNEDETED